MTRSPEPPVAQPTLPDVPAALAEYADRLLLSTGLHAEDVLSIVGGQVEPSAELEPLARALRAGWNAQGAA